MIQEYELGPIFVYVLDYRITFAEKILSLFYASMMDGSASIKETRARVRHFYDLTMLLRQTDVANFLSSADFYPRVQNIRRDDEELNTREKWSKFKLSAAPLFSNSSDVTARIRRIFNPDMEPFVFQPEDLPPFTEVEETIRTIGERIKQLDL